jgi:hypothetical protein
MRTLAELGAASGRLTNIRGIVTAGVAQNLTHIRASPAFDLPKKIETLAV